MTNVGKLEGLCICSTTQAGSTLGTADPPTPALGE